MPENNFNPDKVLASFLDEIVAVKGAGLSKNERLAMRAELRGELDAAVDAAVMAALPEEKLVELNRIAEDDGSDEAIDEFFANVGMNFDKVALSAALQFRKDQLREFEKTSAGVAAPVEGTNVAADANTAAEVAAQGGLSHDMTQNTQANNVNMTAAPEGAPVQGATSEVPGMSNVEGIARMVAGMSEGGENA